MPFQFNALTGNLDLVGAAATGNVIGPGTGATDNAIARFDGTSGLLLQNSDVTIDDVGNIVTTHDINAATLTLPNGDVQGQIDDKASIRLDNLNSTAINISLIPDSDVSYDLGAPSAQWSTVFSQGVQATGSVNTVDLESTGTALFVSVDMQNNPINNVADPSNPQDAATMAYADTKIALTEKGANNGVATLDAGGKVPVSQLPNTVMEYQGAWNASTNSPTLVNGTGNNGDVYRVSVAGSHNFGQGSLSFQVGDFVIYNGTIWEKSPAGDLVTSVNGQQGIVVLSTTDIAEGTNLYYTQARFDAAFAAKSTTNLSEGSNLYFTDERAQDAVGTILADTASIDLTYNDGAPSITADVIPGGVDHNQLLNYVANKHVDHSTVLINTDPGTGLSGGGDITSSRNLSIDITNTTATSSAAASDIFLLENPGTLQLYKITKSNLFQGYATSSPGDLPEGTFSSSNNVASPTNVTGFSFANATVRGFDAIVTVFIDATSDLFEEFKLQGIQKGSLWEMSTSSTGDDSGVTFSITTSGQIQYTSTNVAGFTAGTIKFRAQTLSV